MPRLFIGNFDFEHRLAAPGRQMPAKLQRLNAELATSWLAIADDGDYLWTPESIDAEFFKQAVANGLPRVIPVVSFGEVPAGAECIPWGWTDDIRKLCDEHGWVRNDPSDSAVRAANSRRLSSELEQEWRVGLPFSGEATSIEQVEHYVGLHDRDSRWVIKAEFGMSGRERLLGNGIPQGADRSWIEKRLNSNGIVFFEPWVQKVSEVGIQIDVRREGEPQLLEVVPMIADERGQYSGSRLTSQDSEQSHVTLRPSDWGLAIDIAIQAARRIQNVGYFGPLGIDAMQYQDENQQLHVRPLQDINARWTMGRLCLGFRRFLERYESAEWLRGGVDTFLGSVDLMATLRTFIESKGMRLTPEREAVARAVMETSEPLEAEYLISLLQNQNSRSTVYRTLSLMEEAGLIHQVGNIVIKPRRIPTSPTLVGGTAAFHTSTLCIHPEN